MDIEGSEYEVIDSILTAGIEITQMAIEVHNRFFDDGQERNDRLIAKMNACGYKIFSISETELELSFVWESALSGQ